MNGQAIVKIYLQPGASLDTANAQATAGSLTILRQLSRETLPPLIINCSASSVPILQLGITGQGLSEQQLNDAPSQANAKAAARPTLLPVPVMTHTLPDSLPYSEARLMDCLLASFDL